MDEELNRNVATLREKFPGLGNADAERLVLIRKLMGQENSVPLSEVLAHLYPDLDFDDPAARTTALTFFRQLRQRLRDIGLCLETSRGTRTPVERKKVFFGTGTVFTSETALTILRQSAKATTGRREYICASQVKKIPGDQAIKALGLTNEEVDGFREIFPELSRKDSEKLILVCSLLNSEMQAPLSEVLSTLYPQFNLENPAEKYWAVILLRRFRARLHTSKITSKIIGKSSDRLSTPIRNGTVIALALDPDRFERIHEMLRIVKRRKELSTPEKHEELSTPETCREAILRVFDRYRFDDCASEPHLRLDLMERLAADMQRLQQETISEKNLQIWVEDVLRTTRFGLHFASTMHPADIARDLTDKSLLVKTPQSPELQFISPVFPEYLVASFLYRKLTADTPFSAFLAEGDINTVWDRPIIGPHALDFLGQMIAKTDTQTRDTTIIPRLRLMRNLPYGRMSQNLALHVIDHAHAQGHLSNSDISLRRYENTSRRITPGIAARL